MARLYATAAAFTTLMALAVATALAAAPAAAAPPVTMPPAKFVTTYCNDTPIRSNMTIKAGKATAPSHCDVLIADPGVTLTLDTNADLTVKGNFSLSAADNRAPDAAFVMSRAASITAGRVILHSRLGSVAIGANATITATEGNVYGSSRVSTSVGGGAVLTSKTGHVIVEGRGTTKVAAGARLVAATYVEVDARGTCTVETGVLTSAPKVYLC